VKARVRLGAFVIGALLVCVGIAVVLAPEASSAPDGLERVAIDEGFAAAASDHALADLPTADYAIRGIEDERSSTAAAGVVGVLVTFALAGGLLVVIRRVSASRSGPSSASPAPG
jgi:hypothetical protein